METGNDIEVPLDLQPDPLPADFLPLKCDACSGIFCADHVAYAQHHCGSAYQKVSRQSGGDGEWRMHAEFPESFCLPFPLFFCLSEALCREHCAFVEGMSRFLQDQRFG